MLVTFDNGHKDIIPLCHDIIVLGWWYFWLGL